MKTARLSPLVVGIIGSVFCLLAVGLISYFLIKPTLEKIAVQQARYDANEPDSRLSAQNKAAKDVQKARLQVAQIRYQWAVDEARYMPPFDVSNRPRALRQLTSELTQKLGPDLEHQLRAGGVTPTTAVKLPPPPVSPNEITAAPIIIPLGLITVNGDFRHILTHFFYWQSFNRLVLVDGLSVAGNSPYMQGTYSATLFIFPQNDDKLAPPIAKAGIGGTAAGGAAGGLSGQPGGFGSPTGGSPTGGRPPGR